jgi:tetratricopeptide (TPR) repeat protein
VPVLAAGAPAPAPAGAVSDLLPQAPPPLPTLRAATFDGREVTFLGVAPGGEGRGTGRPLLLVLWSHTCAPCLTELTRLGERHRDLVRAPLDLVALSVDPSEEREAAEAFAARSRFQGTVGFAPPETIAVLDALVATLRDTDRRLGLPASFLVDSEGRLQVVYLGLVDPERVLRDLVLEDLPAEPRRFAAVPFAGRFSGPPPGPDLAWWEAALRRRGLDAAADEFAQGQVDARTMGEAEMAVEVAKARLQQRRLEEAGALFLRATALDPSLADAWKGLGYCRHRAGELEGARDAYRRAAELDPGDDRNVANLALVLVELGDREGARAELARLEERGSEHAEAVRRALGGR